MEKMVELPPSEGGEATITAMSALATVGQYLSTNSAKITFLRNTWLVVKAISSKLPHDQDMQAQNNVVSALQTQVHSLTVTLCETRRDIV